VSLEYLNARIAACKLRIEAYEAAILALTGSGGVQEYQLDTGQTRQRVTKLDLKNLGLMLQMDLNLLAILEARATGSGTTRVGPYW
jgi:hypothetical protein